MKDIQAHPEDNVDKLICSLKDRDGGDQLVQTAIGNNEAEINILQKDMDKNDENDLDIMNTVSNVVNKALFEQEENVNNLINYFNDGNQQIQTTNENSLFEKSTDDVEKCDLSEVIVDDHKTNIDVS